MLHLVRFSYDDLLVTGSSDHQGVSRASGSSGRLIFLSVFPTPKLCCGDLVMVGQLCIFILFLRHKLIKPPLFDFCFNCTSSGDRQLEQPARYGTVRSSPQKSGCHEGQKQGVNSFGKSVDLSVGFCEGTSVIAVVLYRQQWNYQPHQGIIIGKHDRYFFRQHVTRTSGSQGRSRIEVEAAHTEHHMLSALFKISY